MNKNKHLTLSQYLKKYGIIQNFFAEKIGVFPQTLTRLVKGKQIPSLKIALIIERETHGEVSVYSWDVNGIEGIDSEKTNSNKGKDKKN